MRTICTAVCAAFDKYVWQGTEEPDGVRFTRVSPDGEGYPGTLTVSVKFSWQGDGLMLHYTARCDQIRF